MFNISISASTIEEARSKIKALAAQFGVEPAVIHEPGIVASASTASAATAPAAEAPVEPAKPVTKQEVMKAIQKVMTLTTPDEAQSCLERAAGVRKFAQVDPSKYGALLEICNAVIAAAPKKTA